MVEDISFASYVFWMGLTAGGVGLYFWIEWKERRKAGIAMTIFGGLAALLTVKDIRALISNVIGNALGPAILLFTWGVLAYDIALKRRQNKAATSTEQMVSDYENRLSDLGEVIQRRTKEVEDLETRNRDLSSRPSHQEFVKIQNELNTLRLGASQNARTWPHGSVFTVQSVKSEHSDTATYKDKIRIVLTNTCGRDLHVWIPVWEPIPTNFVDAQHPFGSRFRLEGSTGWRNGWEKDSNGKDLEHTCLEVRAGHTCDCYIGLLQPIGKSIEERLRTHTPIGIATFPVRIDGKLYDVPIEL